LLHEVVVVVVVEEMVVVVVEVMVVEVAGQGDMGGGETGWYIVVRVLGSKPQFMQATLEQYALTPTTVAHKLHLNTVNYLDETESIF